MKRKATALWNGTLKEGKGILNTESGAIKDLNYSFKTRFVEGEVGANPEEILAAAHSGCFTMFVSSLLTQKGLEAISLETIATVTMEGIVITGIHLNITGKVPGITSEDFIAVCKEAEKNCPISGALSIPITTEVHLG